MVSPDRTRLRLTSLRMLRAALVAAVPIAGVLILRAPQIPSVATRLTATTAGDHVPPAVPPGMDWYAPLWERDLRQPPFEPQAPPSPSTPVQPAGPVPRLVTTFVEVAARYAHLLDDSGRLRFCSVHDRVGAFEVVAIEPGRAQLTDGTRTIWIEIPKPEKP